MVARLKPHPPRRLRLVDYLSFLYSSRKLHWKTIALCLAGVWLSFIALGACQSAAYSVDGWKVFAWVQLSFAVVVGLFALLIVYIVRPRMLIRILHESGYWCSSAICPDTFPPCRIPAGEAVLLRRDCLGGYELTVQGGCAGEAEGTPPADGAVALLPTSWHGTLHLKDLLDAPEVRGSINIYLTAYPLVPKVVQECCLSWYQQRYKHEWWDRQEDTLLFDYALNANNARISRQRQILTDLILAIVTRVVREQYAAGVTNPASLKVKGHLLSELLNAEWRIPDDCQVLVELVVPEE